MAQKKSPDEPAETSPEETLVFEEAAERLETIVREMEDGRLALEQLISHYEEGMRLVNFCSRSLTAAEKRIEVIQQNARGEVSTAPAEDLEEAEERKPQTPKSSQSSTPRSRSRKASRKGQANSGQQESAADDADSQHTDDELSLF